MNHSDKTFMDISKNNGTLILYIRGYFAKLIFGAICDLKLNNSKNIHIDYTTIIP